MAKYYTEQAPTPVFAVTFVSNRKGIVEQKKVENNTSNTTPQQQLNEEDIKNPQYKYLDGQKEREDYFIAAITKIKKTQKNNPGPQEKERFDKTLKDARDELNQYRKEQLKTFYVGTSDGNKTTIPTEDTEYLIYSNLQIESIGPDDLSQQSNWYLRDADVELTRDMPVCKAKLIVAAKLNDDGSIPQIKQIENGFIYSQSQQVGKDGKPTNNVDFTLISGGRFLSADDEVRIYAGYKNDTCITMNDLDQYPFDFNTLVTKELDNVSKQQLAFLDKQKTAIQNAIETLKNPFTDSTLYLNIGIALLPLALKLIPVAGGKAALTSVANVSTKAISVPSATTPTVINAGTRTLSTNVLPRAASRSITTTSNTVNNSTIAANKQLSTNVLSRTTSNSASTNATLNPPASNLDVLAAQAYNKAIASGLGITAATIVALNLVLSGSANAEEADSKQIQNIYPQAITRNYLEGRQYLNDNKELFNLLNIELDSINKLIQVVQKKAGTDLKKFSSSKNKIAPIFWGFIDSVDFISNSDAGVQIIYNLRDRSRILADTKLVTLPYLNKDSNERGAFEGLRHKTIEGVYRATNGGVYLDNNYISATNIQWRDGFDVGEVITLYDNKIDGTGNRISDQVGKVTDIGSALAEQRIKFSAAIEDQARWTIANSFLSSKDIKSTALSKYDPLFHIWTLQPPVVQGGGQSVMQIVNKSPFEILTYLQVTEVMPIDFFSSHVNGHFLFAPRVLDTTGLNDPERGNRLYFFFQCFDKTPEARNLIKDIRVQTSTIGVYNRFAIANAEFNNPTNASLTDLYTVVDIASANTKNRKVPIKQHIIVDPKIKDQSNKEGYAQGLALTTASIMARDNTTVIFKIIGDSTFYPGEAVRVYNTVLHGKDTFTFNSQTESSANFLRDLYKEVQNLKEGNGTVKQEGSQNKVVNLNSVIDNIRKGSGTQSDDLNDVLPMYKVRAITHSLKAGGSDAGYTTKIVAIADIL